jgi:hypothetical protein
MQGLQQLGHDFAPAAGEVGSQCLSDRMDVAGDPYGLNLCLAPRPARTGGIPFIEGAGSLEVRGQTAKWRHPDGRIDAISFGLVWTPDTEPFLRRHTPSLIRFG